MWRPTGVLQYAPTMRVFRVYRYLYSKIGGILVLFSGQYNASRLMLTILFGVFSL